MRQCGDCQLCCTLVPVPPLGKGANKRCAHQRFGKGCTIYARRPSPCKWFSCKWLANDDAGELRRPDRAGYVIDPMPDFVTLADDETGAIVRRVPVEQVWCDPKRPDAHRDPALRAWLIAKRVPALIRFNESDGLLIVPPNVNAAGVWHEQTTGTVEREHSLAEVLNVLASKGA